MASRMIAVIVVMLACVGVARGDFPTTNVTHEGYPRPKNFPDTPTVAYGKLPLTMDTCSENCTNAVCDWYGWANVNYPADAGARCLPHVWDVEVIAKDPNMTHPRVPWYYFSCAAWSMDPLCYDAVANDIICTIGCFDLSNTSLSLPPVTTPPPPSPPGTPPGITTIVTGAAAVLYFFHPSSMLQLGSAVAAAAAVIFY